MDKDPKFQDNLLAAIVLTASQNRAEFLIRILLREKKDHNPFSINLGVNINRFADAFKKAKNSYKLLPIFTLAKQNTSARLAHTFLEEVANAHFNTAKSHAINKKIG